VKLPIHIRTITVVALFMAFLFVPHALLASPGLYFPKLRVDPTNGTEFFIGLLCTFALFVTFILSLAGGGIGRVRLAEQILALEKRTSYKFLMVGMTISLFLLLAIGIGGKQSTSQLNFIIRILPREMILILATLAAVVTLRRLWIILVVINILYWVLVGSKASLFILALTVIFVHSFERWPIRGKHLFWGAITLMVLPFSFMIGRALHLGIHPLELFRLTSSSPETVIFFLSSILARVSWFDGMLLTAVDAAPLQKFTVLDFFEITASRLLPGISATQEPLGQQIIYLFQAIDLQNFSGAVGMPGVLKIFYYNHGILGLTTVLLLLFTYFYFLTKMMVSRKVIIATTGFSVFIVAMSSLIISGNIDSALGKSIPILIMGVFFQGIFRLLFTKPQYRVGAS
jgi:hypothetical protein